MSENASRVKEYAQPSVRSPAQVHTSVVRAEVFFPCVHGERTGTLVGIWAFCAHEMGGRIKVVSSPLDDQDASRVISASRYWEYDGRKADGVIASISGSAFSGASYELALAIVDKLARYGALLPESRIIASGRIPSDGNGLVGAINHFATKLRIIASERVVKTIFVFPRQNLDDASEKERELLAQLKAQGVNTVAVSDINDLSGVLWPDNSNLVRSSRCRQNALHEIIPRVLLMLFDHSVAAVALSLIAVLGIVVWWQDFSWDGEDLPGIPGEEVSVAAGSKSVAVEASQKQVVTAAQDEAPAKADARSDTVGGVAPTYRPIESRMIDTNAY